MWEIRPKEPRQSWYAGALGCLFSGLWYTLGRNYRLAGLVTFGAPKAMGNSAVSGRSSAVKNC